MWDEDPRLHEHNWRLLRVFAIATPGLALLLSALTRDWSILVNTAEIYGITLGALGLYGAAIWLTGHAARLAIQIFKRSHHRR